MRKRAFTMIELLVVIGIIAVLVAIVIPSLSYAKKSANKGACIGNLRELGYDTQGFLNDNRGQFFGHYSDTSTLWINQLRPYGNLDKTRFCPEALGRSNNVKLSPNWGTTLGGSIGSATDSWTYDSSMTYWNSPFEFTQPYAVGSYTVNASLYCDRGGNWGKFPLNGPNANIPMFADGIWIDSTPGVGNFTVSSHLNLQYGLDDGYNIYGDSSMGSIGIFAIGRHGHAINAVFADGHAESIPLPRLWTLNWVKGWVQPATLPVIPN